MEITYDAFISYSRDDLEVAGRIQEYLEAAGLDCYRDVTHIPESAPWVLAITGAIKRSHTIVAIVSRSSIASDVAGKEIHCAGTSGRPIVPLFLSRDIVNFLPELWQFHLSGLNYIFAEEPLDSTLSKIGAAVNRLVDRSRHTTPYGDEADVLGRNPYHRFVDPGGDRLGLPVGDLDDGVASLEGKSYVFQSRPGKFFGHRLDALPVTSEFVFEAQTLKTAGPDTEWFGLEFGASWPDPYYQFLLNGEGTLRVSRQLNREWTDLIVARPQNFAHAAGTPNRLKVVRKGEAIHLLVNDRYVASANDFNIRTGLPGLVVGRDLRVEFSRIGVQGIGLEAVFRKALDHWRQLETLAAKQCLAYVVRYDPAFRVADWPDAGHLLREIQPDRSASILIVIGDSAVAQFNDGFHSERLRHQINEKGKGDAFRWAVLVTDAAILRDPRYLECPVIAVGGPPSNQITARLQGKVPRVPVGRENIQVQHNIGSGDKQLALWGPMASDTGDAVEYAISSGLLDEFLKMLWKD